MKTLGDAGQGGRRQTPTSHKKRSCGGENDREAKRQGKERTTKTFSHENERIR
jgi:hypothetical protein